MKLVFVPHPVLSLPRPKFIPDSIIHPKTPNPALSWVFCL